MPDLKEQADELRRVMQEEQNPASSVQPVEEDDTENNETLEIPAPLRRLQYKQCMTAAALTVVTIIVSIAFRAPEALVLLIFCAYFLCLAFFVSYDWAKGNIDQRVVACVQVVNGTKTQHVICRDIDHIYDYMLPGKRSLFVEGGTYVVWTHRDRPKAIMAYTPI